MSSDPDSVVRAAFGAVAVEDAATLERLVDPESLEERRLAAMQMAAHGKQMLEEYPGSEDAYRRMLAELHVDSAEELGALSPVEMLRRSLASLPKAARNLDCQVLGHVLEGRNLAHVLFRIRWAGEPPAPRAPIHVATLRRNDGHWKLVVELLSQWIVPGFDNMIVFDPEDATW